MIVREANNEIGGGYASPDFAPLEEMSDDQLVEWVNTVRKLCHKSELYDIVIGDIEAELRRRSLDIDGAA